MAILATAAAFGQVDANRTVAVVNGEEIKGGEYYHRMEYLTGVGQVVNNGIQQFPPGFMAIERLIEEHLLLQLAKTKGVYPSTVEVDNELKARLEDDPKLMENWLNTGQTEADLKYQMLVEVARFKVATAGVTVTDQEIETHYAQNAATMYTLAKRVKLAVIVVSDDTAQKMVDDELAAKKPFADVAKAHSTDVTKGIGGELGNVYINVLKPEVQAALDQVKIGGTTGWLTSKDARVKFLLEDVTLPKKLPLDASLRRQIRRRLMIDRGANKNDVAKEMFNLRMNAKIDIKDKTFADVYAKFLDALRQDAALKAAGRGGN